MNIILNLYGLINQKQKSKIFNMSSFIPFIFFWFLKELFTEFYVTFHRKMTILDSVRFPLHGQPLYIWISDQGQPFRYHFVLQRTDIGLIKKTINRTSRCNKADADRLFASYYRLNLLLLKAQRCMMGRHLKFPLYIVTLRNYRLSIGAINVF